MSISINSYSARDMSLYGQNMRGRKPEQEKAEEADGKQAEQCTGNTDKVDAEIRKLKKKEAELKQRIARAGSPEEQERLKSELLNVQNELRVKDNDAYRRAHTQFH